jgi:hypothetical protein
MFFFLNGTCSILLKDKLFLVKSKEEHVEVPGGLSLQARPNVTFRQNQEIN